MSTRQSAPRESGNTGQGMAAWIWGGAFALFVVGVFCFAPPSLAEYKQRILGFICALLAGFFGYFLTGSLGVNAQPKLAWLGRTAIKSSGGFAMFLAVLAWWYSPAAPIQATPNSMQNATSGPVAAGTAAASAPEKYNPDTFISGYVYRKDEVKRVDYAVAEGALPSHPDEFLSVSDVDFDVRHNVLRVTLSLHNVTSEPLLLSLKRDYFNLEDDAGRKGELLDAALPTGILPPDDSRSIRLYFDASGWQGKQLHARTIRLEVNGLLPLVRGTWTWHTLATAAEDG